MTVVASSPWRRLGQPLMKRLLDVSLGLIAAVLSIVPLLFLAFLIKLTSRGPVLYWSNRIGRNNIVFPMPKLRTMRVGTEVVATHLLRDPDGCLTPIGGFLRKSSLDELPQLWCVLRGDMSIVGPRPALFNQDDLIQMRTDSGIHVIRPGLTGWAQVNGRDALLIPKKVELDFHYLRHQSLTLDLKVICLTILKVVGGDGVKH